MELDNRTRRSLWAEKSFAIEKTRSLGLEGFGLVQRSRYITNPLKLFWPVAKKQWLDCPLPLPQNSLALEIDS
jgi:hypothetical protein